MLNFDPTMPNEWCATCNTATPQALLDTGQYGCARHNTNPKIYAKPATLTRPVFTEPVSEIPDWML